MKSACLIAAAIVCLPASAEVVMATADHYTLRHEAVSKLSVEEIWERLIQPDTWWHPDHTYSGDAEHLWLNPNAGGPWMESWEGNVVEHGRVLSILENRMLRLDAPFGPLQGLGVQVVWTITLEADVESGNTKIVFDEVANGSSQSDLAQIAPAVDIVKQQAIERLADPSLTD
ncbi:hypothetical protein D1224_04515 [Henriciella barbarensis]|uniref:SRPBCC domain-containing protein n=1 Tax=Henriciella barbarensis TaxID=86342 RepID=A0A399QYD5_9PROT|nr:hypothetical protein [Henriciella barbarensis]RIJ23531.1 hypothetical protein D1224_04515 [Henriciella barbarensis]